jgi:hypothetical protein
MNKTNNTEIENLRSFAVAHDVMGFAHMCDAALDQEQWAIERLRDARFRMDGPLDHEPVLNNWALIVILSTNTTR